MNRHNLSVAANPTGNKQRGAEATCCRALIINGCEQTLTPGEPVWGWDSQLFTRHCLLAHKTFINEGDVDLIAPKYNRGSIFSLNNKVVRLSSEQWGGDRKSLKV